MLNLTKIRKTSLLFVLVAFLGIASASIAKADPVPVGSLIPSGTRDVHGTGFGVVLPILTLAEPHPHGTSETGAIGWNGSQDVVSGDAFCNGSVHCQTYSFQDLVNNGFTASNLGLVYNINEPGSASNTFLNDVRLRVYDSAGNWVFQTGLCGNGTRPCPGDFPQIDSGQGKDGYLFSLDANAQAALAAYFANPNGYRLGLYASIDQTTGGQEDFYLAQVQPQVVPEPASMFLLGMGLMGVAAGVRRRSHRKV